MEQPMRCKTLTAIYKNEINTLKKLYEIDFLIHKSVRIHIEQFTVCAYKNRAFAYAF